MKAIKALLAVSALSVAGAASAAVLPLTANLVSQVPPIGTQTLSGNTNFSGSIDVDMTNGLMTAFSITSLGDYTSTSSLGPAITVYGGSTWTAILGGGIMYDTENMTVDENFNLVVTYEWGDLSQDSNAAGSFSGPTPTCSGPFCQFAQAGNPGWDFAQLIVAVNADLEVVSATLKTSEVGAQGTAVTTYELAPEVPLPAAAWLFGSGLIGLAGVVRRRRAAA